MTPEAPVRVSLWVTLLVAPLLGLAATVFLAIVAREPGPLYLAGPWIAPATVALASGRGAESKLWLSALLSLTVATALAMGALSMLAEIPPID